MSAGPGAVHTSPFESFRAGAFSPAGSLQSIAIKCIAKHPKAALRNASLPPSASALDARRAELADAIAKALTHAKAWDDDVFPPDLLGHVRALVLANNNRLTASYLLCIAPRCSMLEALDLSGMFSLYDAHAAEIVPLLPALRFINISNCRRITDASLAPLFRHKLLSHIDVGGCFNITEPGLFSALSAHPRLERLSGLGLSGVDAVSDRLLELLASRCVHLLRLSLGFSLCTEASITALITANPLLTFLQLPWCEGVGEAAVSAIISACPLLYHADFTGLKGVDALAVQALLTARAPTAQSMWADTLTTLAGGAAAASASRAAARAHWASNISLAGSGGGSGSVAAVAAGSTTVTVSSAAATKFPALRAPQPGLSLASFDGDVGSHASQKLFELEPADWADFFVAADRLMQSPSPPLQVSPPPAAPALASAPAAAGVSGTQDKSLSEAAAEYSMTPHGQSIRARRALAPFARGLRSVHIRYAAGGSSAASAARPVVTAANTAGLILHVAS